MAEANFGILVGFGFHQYRIAGKGRTLGAGAGIGSVRLTGVLSCRSLTGIAVRAPGGAGPELSPPPGMELPLKASLLPVEKSGVMGRRVTGPVVLPLPGIRPDRGDPQLIVVPGASFLSQASHGHHITAPFAESVPQPGPHDLSLCPQGEDRRFHTGFQAPGLAFEPALGGFVKNELRVPEVNGRAGQDSAGNQDFELQLLALKRLEGVVIHLSVLPDPAVEVGGQFQQLSAAGAVMRFLLFLNDRLVADHKRHRPRQAPLGEESKRVSPCRGIPRDIDPDRHLLAGGVVLGRESGLLQDNLLDRLHFGSQAIAIQPDGPDPFQIFSAQPEFQ